MLSLNMHHGERSQSHYWIFTDSSHDSNRNAHCQFTKASRVKRGQTEGTGSGVCQQRLRMSWNCLLLQEKIWWGIAEDSWREGDCRQLLTKRGTRSCAPKGALKLRPPGPERKTKTPQTRPLRHLWVNPPFLRLKLYFHPNQYTNHRVQISGRWANSVSFW